MFLKSDGVLCVFCIVVGRYFAVLCPCVALGKEEGENGSMATHGLLVLSSVVVCRYTKVLRNNSLVVGREMTLVLHTLCEGGPGGRDEER